MNRIFLLLANPETMISKATTSKQVSMKMLHTTHHFTWLGEKFATKELVRGLEEVFV